MEMSEHKVELMKIQFNFIVVFSYPILTWLQILSNMPFNCVIASDTT